MTVAQTSLKIVQYNLRKSRSQTIELFERDQTRGIDILAIQEPWRRPDGATSIHPDKHFHLIWPQALKARVCFYVNNRISLSAWSFREKDRDLGALNLMLQGGGDNSLPQRIQSLRGKSRIGS